MYFLFNYHIIACLMLVCLRELVNVNVVCMFSSPSLIPQALTHSNKDALN